MKTRKAFNPKRRIEALTAELLREGQLLAERATYVGSPQHKRRPNDYGLVPATDPRPGKTLCDATGVFPKVEAMVLLVKGLSSGMVSVQRRNGWPQNVWSVRNGAAFESELENQEQGTYHGYPMPKDDPFSNVVLREWTVRER